MILFEILETEAHPVYEKLEISNGIRQYDFLRSIVEASLEVKRPFISTQLLKALNFQAISCLHTNAGEYRPCAVQVGTYVPPQHYRVQALMDDFINSVNRIWETADPIALASLVLWRLNHIHPFINGNGRVARAVSYFVLCVKLEKWLPGKTILPELLRLNREEYVTALRAADASVSTGQLDVSALHYLISKLLDTQIQSASEPNITE